MGELYSGARSKTDSLSITEAKEITTTDLQSNSINNTFDSNTSDADTVDFDAIFNDSSNSTNYGTAPSESINTNANQTGNIISDTSIRRGDMPTSASTGPPSNAPLTHATTSTLGTTSNGLLPGNIEKLSTDSMNLEISSSSNFEQNNYATSPQTVTGNSINSPDHGGLAGISFELNTATSFGTSTSDMNPNVKAASPTQEGNTISSTHTTSYSDGSENIPTVETTGEIEERELTSQEFINNFFELSDEEKEKYLGTLSQEEYNQLLNKVQKQYETTIADIESAIKDTDAKLKTINDILIYVRDYYDNYKNYYDSCKNEISKLYYDGSFAELKKRYGLTDEDLKKDFNSIIEKAMSSEHVKSNLKVLEDILNQQLQDLIENDENYQEYSGLTYSELLTLQSELSNGQSVLKSILSGQQTTHDTAEYDLLLYEKDYYDFINQDRSINPDDIEGYETTMGYPSFEKVTMYDYQQFKKEHPDADPVEYYLACMKKGIPSQFIIGIDNLEEIKQLVGIKQYQEDVANGTSTSRIPLTNTTIDYLSFYQYLLATDPKKADELLKNINPILTYYKGAYQAEMEIEQLGELIDTEEIKNLYESVNNLDVNDTEKIEEILEQIKSLDIKDKDVVLKQIEALDLSDKENLQQNLMVILDNASGLQKLKETLANDLNVSVDGLGDGIYDFFEGFGKLFSDGKISAQDYKVMIYMSYLEQHSYFLDNIYKTSMEIGTMLPVVTFSTILSAAAPGLAATTVPFIGGNAVSNMSLALMGISSYGTTHNQLLSQGYADSQAILYALLSSSSSLLFKKFGGLIGLADTPGSNFLTSMLKEAKNQTVRQLLMSFIGDSLILGKEIDITNMPQQAFETFLSSLVVSGVLNAYTKGLTIVVDKVRYEITGADAAAIAKYLDSLDKKSNFSWKELGKILEYKEQNNCSIEVAAYYFRAKHEMENYDPNSSTSINLSFLDGTDINTKNTVLSKMIFDMDTNKAESFLKMVGKQYGISDATMSLFSDKLMNDANWDVAKIDENAIAEYMNNHAGTNRRMAILELTKKTITVEEISKYKQENPDDASKPDEWIRREIALDKIETGYQEKFAFALITIEEYNRRCNSGYFTIPIEQVFLEKVLSKTDPTHVVATKEFGTDGKYNDFFPTTDYFVSDEAVVNYMKSCVSSDNPDLARQFKSLKTIDEMGAFLEAHQGELYVNSVTFQNNAAGANNLFRFEAIGNTSDMRKGGLYSLIFEDFKNGSSTYPEIYEFDSNGNIIIHDMEAFGKEILSGVPLNGDEGAIMIRVKTPLNSNTIQQMSMPSVTNGSAYTANFISGGELGSQNHEIVIAGTPIDPTAVQNEIKSTGSYTYTTPDGIEYEVTIIKQQK